MDFSVQLASGFFLGLLMALSVALVRPLAAFALLASVGLVVATLWLSGVPGLIDLFGQANRYVATYASFFGALGIGLVGGTVAISR